MLIANIEWKCVITCWTRHASAWVNRDTLTRKLSLMPPQALCIMTKNNQNQNELGFSLCLTRRTFKPDRTRKHAHFVAVCYHNWVRDADVDFVSDRFYFWHRQSYVAALFSSFSTNSWRKCVRLVQKFSGTEAVIRPREPFTNFIVILSSIRVVWSSTY